MAKPSLLLLIPQSPFDAASGAAVSERTGCEMLARAGWRVRVVGTTATEAHQSSDISAVLGSLDIPYVRESGNRRRAVVRFSHRGVGYRLVDSGTAGVSEVRRMHATELDALVGQEIRDGVPDVVLTYGSSEDEVRRRARLKRLGARIVFSVRNLAYLHPRAFEAVDAIICASQYVRRYYLDRVGVEMQVLPLPVSVDDVVAPFTQPTYLTLINPAPQKGVAFFLRLVAECGKRWPELRFLVVEARGSIGTLAATADVLGLNLGAFKNLSVAETTLNPAAIYAVTRVLLMPSLIEPAGRSAIEAQLNRVPVVASDRGGLPEMVGSGGFVLPVPDDATSAAAQEQIEEWARVIRKLCGNEKFYAKASDAAYEAASEHRSGSVENARTEFFRDLLKRRVSKLPRRVPAKTAKVKKVRRRLLFLSPVMPSRTGRGSAMRAAAMLEVLSRWFDVSLLVAEVFRQRSCSADEELLRSCCSEVVVREDIDLVEEEVSSSGLPFTDFRFDVVHANRLVLSRAALLCRDRCGSTPARCTLDLDDYESKASARFAELYASIGAVGRTRKALRAQRELFAAEDRLIPHFDTVFAANPGDCDDLATRFPGSRFVVAPNVIGLPKSDEGKRRVSPFAFLFVGSLDYFPNEDAVVFFCDEVLPRLRKMTSKRFQVRIAGPNPSSRVLALASNPEVEIAGEVRDLAPLYRKASAAIVPIRAGGGSRIKLLEAASYGVPIVTTAIGAEGFSVENGREVLLADEPAMFACECARLLNRPALRGKLASQALDWVKRNHTSPSLAAAIGKVFRGS